MSVYKIHILNIDVSAITEHELLERFHQGVLFTPNLDHLVRLQKDKEFYRDYRRADWIVCDSRILLLCSKLLGKSFPEAVPGSGFFHVYCDYHKDDANCRIFLLGSKENTANLAMEKINSRLGRNIVVDALSPSMGFDQNEDECRLIVERIKRSGANVVLVGVGSPKQEKWIMKWKDQMPNVKTWMALGATIDFESGLSHRPPMIWRRLCMEWFYRFLHDPRRLFRRYFIDDMKFFWYFFKQLIGVYKDPFAE